MNMNKPITSTKNNYGLTSLVGGILQVLFGFSASFVGIAILAITCGAGIKSHISEKSESSRTTKAKVGMFLSALMVILYYTVGFAGVVMPIIGNSL